MHQEKEFQPFKSFPRIGSWFCFPVSVEPIRAHHCRLSQMPEAISARPPASRQEYPLPESRLRGNHAGPGHHRARRTGDANRATCVRGHRDCPGGNQHRGDSRRQPAEPGTKASRARKLFHRESRGYGSHSAGPGSSSKTGRATQREISASAATRTGGAFSTARAATPARASAPARTPATTGAVTATVVGYRRARSFSAWSSGC